MSITKLAKNHLWLHGAGWLYSDIKDTPESSTPLPVPKECRCEMKHNDTIHSLATIQDDNIQCLSDIIDIERFSSSAKLYHDVTGLVLITLVTESTVIHQTHFHPTQVSLAEQRYIGSEIASPSYRKTPGFHCGNINWSSGQMNQVPWDAKGKAPLRPVIRLISIHQKRGSGGPPLKIWNSKTWFLTMPHCPTHNYLTAR